MAKNEKKQSKKKLLIILLLLAIAGMTGYGVYSYYMTQGNYEATSNSVSVLSFDPNVEIDGSSDFLGEGGSIQLNCPYTSGSEELTCTASLQVRNDGGTAIDVEVLDGDSDYHHATRMSADVDDPEFSWETTQLAAGESTTLNIEVPVDISSEYSSNSEYETSVPIDGNNSYVYISVSFRLKATQVHN